jgi:hypothetical protein
LKLIDKDEDGQYFLWDNEKAKVLAHGTDASKVLNYAVRHPGEYIVATTLEMKP